MKFAPIMPVHAQDMLENRTYNLCFTELVLGHLDYRAHYKYRSVGNFAIMDIMTYEKEFSKGHEKTAETSLDMVAEAAELIRPDVIISPDRLDDVYGTLVRLKGALAFGLNDIAPLMGVVQGANYQELKTCTDAMVHMCGCEYLAFPNRRKTDALEGMTRDELVLRLVAEGLDPEATKIHLLGATDTFDDVRALVKEGIPIMGFDSAKPVKVGLAGIRLDFIYPDTSGVQRPTDFFETPRDVVKRCLETIQHNVHVLDAICVPV